MNHLIDTQSTSCSQTLQKLLQDLFLSVPSPFSVIWLDLKKRLCKSCLLGLDPILLIPTETL